MVFSPRGPRGIAYLYVIAREPKLRHILDAIERRLLVQGAGIMGKPAEYCRNAHDCLDLARQTRNEAHQRLLLDLAVKWLQLAGVTRREIGTLMDAGKAA
jgi:hypothetical protein